MKELFLIERAWIDPMENRDADGYDPIGFVISEDEAKRICNEGGFYTVDDCWSIQFLPDKKLPKFRYKKLPNIVDEDLKIQKLKMLSNHPDYEFRHQMAGVVSSHPDFKCDICENKVNSIVQTAYHKHNLSSISICGDCYQLFYKMG